MRKNLKEARQRAGMIKVNQRKKVMPEFWQEELPVTLGKSLSP